MFPLFLTILVFSALLTPIFPSKVRNNQVFGNVTLGYYYVEVFVGSNQVPQTLIIDTGSYTIAFPCQNCKECGKHTYPYFNSSASTTYEPIKLNTDYYNWKCSYSSDPDVCDFYEGYVEGSSYSGKLGLDSLIFKTEIDHPSGNDNKAIFGCAEVETNEFFGQSVNGIMGLAPETTNFSKPPTILQIEQIEGRISQNVFSLCLGRNGGQIGFGGDNNMTHVSEKTMTLNSSNLSWDYFYNINFDGMKVG